MTLDLTDLIFALPTLYAAFALGRVYEAHVWADDIALLLETEDDEP